jgi:hypothetical protein
MNDADSINHTAKFLSKFVDRDTFGLVHDWVSTHEGSPLVWQDEVCAELGFENRVTPCEGGFIELEPTRCPGVEQQGDDVELVGVGSNSQDAAILVDLIKKIFNDLRVTFLAGKQSRFGWFECHGGIQSHLVRRCH